MSTRTLVRQGHALPDWRVPERPWTFGKFPASVIGPREAIIRPVNTVTLDAEGELAAVIGRTGRFIPIEEAGAFLAGYTLLNDVSDRAVELRPTPSINHRLLRHRKEPRHFLPVRTMYFYTGGTG